MPRAKSEATHAVYRGGEVKLFNKDLSNYAQLRRGLSPAMRAQTLSKTELKNVDPDLVEKYINSLNKWRQRPQREKIERGQPKEVSALESIFNKALNSNFFTGEDRFMIAAANLKMKAMTEHDARTQIREALNAVNRVHGGDWYRPQDYWASEYYMENNKWDPEMASDSMLQLAIDYDLITDFPQYEELTKAEYISRFGDSNGTLMASEVASARQDILATAKLFVAGKEPDYL